MDFGETWMIRIILHINQDGGMIWGQCGKMGLIQSGLMKMWCGNLGHILRLVFKMLDASEILLLCIAYKRLYSSQRE